MIYDVHRSRARNRLTEMRSASELSSVLLTVLVKKKKKNDGCLNDKT